MQLTWGFAQRWGGLWPDTVATREFAYFGAGALVGFPSDALSNPEGISIGDGTLIGPHSVLAAGFGPGFTVDRVVVEIGQRCVIGRGSSIIGHDRIRIGDDVWTGHQVHITDMNHGTDDPDVPIGEQFGPLLGVEIGSGTWIGHGVVILPGARIGTHCVIGAGAVVTGEIPDRSVAVGVPARVVSDRR